MHPQLHALYLKYKEDTNAVVKWLLQYGTEKDKRSRSLSVKDLQRLVGVACQNNLHHHDSIKYRFEAAIKRRQRLTNHFKCKGSSHDAATVTHEFFTQR